MIAGVRQMAAAEDVVIAARPLGKAKTMTTLVGMAVLLLALDAQTGGPLAATGLGDGIEGVGFWIMVAGDRADARLGLGLPARRAAAAPGRRG